MRPADKVARIMRLLEKEYGRPSLASRPAPLDSLISTILSQRCSSRMTRALFAALKQSFPTWDELLAASPKRIERILKPGGLSRQKSRNIRRILLRLRRTGSLQLEFLRDFSDEAAYRFLTGLPGVGQKTAKIVMLFSLGRQVFPVDTHIARLAKRLGVAPVGSPPETISAILEALLPPGKALSFHLNMIRLGRERCRAQRPLCSGCPLAKECLYVRLHRT